MKTNIRTLDNATLAEELGKLERRYSMSSWDFYARYREGQVEESTDYVYWAGLCYIALRSGLLARPGERV